MARQARQVSGTGIYHVMMRGINRQNIFEDEEDYKRFRELLFQMVYPIDDTGKDIPARCTFYAYCMMSNHVHLLIRETAENLSDVIKRIGVSYAQYFNKKYVHFGHLFQDRFKSEPVNDDSYFFTVLRYIHQNPLAAGIVGNVESYPWSSWGEYERAGNGIPAICSTRPVLARIPLDDLRSLVEEPLPKTYEVLEFDNSYRSKTDEEMREFFNSSFGIERPNEIQMYSRDRQNDMLRAAKQFGGSIRQIVRLTGISFTVVRNA